MDDMRKRIEAAEASGSIRTFRGHRPEYIKRKSKDINSKLLIPQIKYVTLNDILNDDNDDDYLYDSISSDD